MLNLALQSVPLSWVDPVEIATSRAILEAIQRRAIERWGDKWMAELTKEYVKIAVAHGDEKATTVNRRSQLERLFKAGSCTLEKAIWLAAAVGCRFQLACSSIEVTEF